jgi:Ala-tRNA(Pro) deacylase
MRDGGVDLFSDGKEQEERSEFQIANKTRTVPMSAEITSRIRRLLDHHRANYTLLEHEPCVSAPDCTQARRRAGGPEDVGAKSLLCKLDFPWVSEFVVFVLPGPARFESRAIKKTFRQLKGFRFATRDELLHLTGVVPGALPPFAAPVFPEVKRLVVDESLLKAERVGFNAGTLVCSIVMSGPQYLRIARPDLICRVAAFAEPAASEHELAPQ